MRIGFLTARAWRRLTADDRLAAAALEAEGCTVEPVVWNDGPSLGHLNLLVVRTPWDYYKRAEAFGRFWEGIRGVRVLNDPRVIRWNLSKQYLLDLQARGVPVVPSRLVPGPEALEDLPWEDLVVKPLVSAGAYLTFRLKRAEGESRRADLEALFRQGPALAQPYCDSIARTGEYSLVYFRDPAGVAYSHALLKRPAPGDFRCQEKHGGSLAAVTPPAAFREATEAALSAIPGPWLYARMDLVEWEGRPVVGEIEVFEPELFFRLDPEAPRLFARKVLGWLR